IRDLTVTGVQTCALPIWLWVVDVEAAIHVECGAVAVTAARSRSVLSAFGVAATIASSRSENFEKSDQVLPVRFSPADGSPPAVRSEERRVGKECRSGGGG